MADARVAGQIYDIGYQHYDGRRLGRGYAFRTLIAYSIRSAFGAGRGAKGRIVPIIVIALVYAPVLIQLVIAATDPSGGLINYAQQLEFAGLFIALFAAAQAPEVIVTDRQFGVLPLYVSRSIRLIDYAFAKVIAMACALLMLTLVPELALFLGRIALSATPWDVLHHTWKQLGPIFGGTTLAALYVGTVALALGSLANRRAYGTASVIAFFMILPVLGGISQRVLWSDSAGRYVALENPFQVMEGFSNWLFEVQNGGPTPETTARQAAIAARRAALSARGGRVRIPPPAEPVSGWLYLAVMAGTIGLASGVLAIRFGRNRE